MQRVEVFFTGTGNAFNAHGRANLSFLIKSGNFTCCVEAGPTLLYQLAKYRINPGAINQLFISHFHGDHTAGIPFLMLYRAVIAKSRYPFRINGPAGIREFCRNLYQMTYPEINLDTGVEYCEFPVKITRELPLEGEDLLEIYPMDHQPESLAYKFKLAGKTIAFTGDTRWNDNLPLLAEGADILIMECTTLEKSIYSHLSFTEIAENLDYLEAKEFIPVHLDKTIVQAFQDLQHVKIRIVEDGEKIAL